jgi:hypothetical protein
MRSASLTILGLFWITAGMAQVAAPQISEPDIIYNHQITGGLNLHSNGFGAFFHAGKFRGVKTLWYLGADFVSMKHEKEVKSFNPVYEDSKSYVYGKTNSFYVFRPYLGKRKIISRKERPSGVEVSYTWALGPSVGITKPVYLEIGYPSIPYDYLAVERYDPQRHFFDDIYGRASGLRGLGELKVHPGAFGRFAMAFEYHGSRERLKGIEVGVDVDAYATEIPIMAPDIVNSNRQYFLTFHLNLFFGRKHIKR